MPVMRKWASRQRGVRPKARSRRFILQDSRANEPQSAGLHWTIASGITHEATEARVSASAQFVAGALSFRIADRASKRLGDLGTRGFGATFATLLALSAIFCAVVGAMRREMMFGAVLTHWDEAAAYAIIGWLLRYGTVNT